MYGLSVTSCTLIQFGNYEIVTTQSHEVIALADEKGTPFWRAQYDQYIGDYAADWQRVVCLIECHLDNALSGRRVLEDRHNG